MIQKYEQSTFETCLAVDLLNLVGTEISKKIEREKEVPKKIEAELTARITYDLSEGFSLNEQDFILDQISESCPITEQ